MARVDLSPLPRGSTTGDQHSHRAAPGSARTRIGAIVHEGAVGSRRHRKPESYGQPRVGV